MTCVVNNCKIRGKTSYTCQTQIFRIWQIIVRICLCVYKQIHVGKGLLCMHSNHEISLRIALASFRFPISLSASFCFVLKSESFIIALYYQTNMNMHELSPAFACLLSLPLWMRSYCGGSIVYASYEENFLP